MAKNVVWCMLDQLNQLPEFVGGEAESSDDDRLDDFFRAFPTLMEILRSTYRFHGASPSPDVYPHNRRCERASIRYSQTYGRIHFSLPSQAEFAATAVEKYFSSRQHFLEYFRKSSGDDSLEVLAKVRFYTMSSSDRPALFASSQNC